MEESETTTANGAEAGASPDPQLPGPFPVGRYAHGFRDFLRRRPRVLVLGEVAGLRKARASTYFELRDAEGAVPCAIWSSDLDKLEIPDGLLCDGAQVVVGGGPDYYPGSATSSPSFSFRATHVRLAGEGDLLAQLARLRRKLEAEGLFKPQKVLRRPLLPKVIGVVTARGSAASADLLAGLERRAWKGTILWADAPVQDQRAAPRISRAMQDLASAPDVDVIVVCRGGGSLASLWAFCDEHLCRTVALLGVPVISAIGHESDRTLIDDVAAACCSTPTHAAPAAVGLDIPAARLGLRSSGSIMRRVGVAAVALRARRLRDLSRVPAHHLQRERSRLHQLLREVRASSTRSQADRQALVSRAALVMARKGEACGLEAQRAKGASATFARAIELRASRARSSREDALRKLSIALRAHEPDRVIERGYALVEDRAGEVITTAAAARKAKKFRVRFRDDAVDATATDHDGQTS